MKKNSFLAIIPARAGSKRLPDKNIKNLNGKPLISYTIEAALKSKYITETVVTTDSEKIKFIANQYGASTPFLRPKELALDETSSIDVVIHCINYYKENFNKEFDFVILLQPTSPLRNELDLDNAIEYLIEKNADAVISVCEMEHNPIWSNILNESCSMENFLDEKYINKRTQDLPKYYRINGAIYICKISKLMNEKRLLIRENIYAYKMSQQHSVDIDTNLDFILAKTILEEKNESTY